jgi:hypothetical protein
VFSVCVCVCVCIRRQLLDTWYTALGAIFSKSSEEAKFEFPFVFVRLRVRISFIRVLNVHLYTTHYRLLIKKKETEWISMYSTKHSLSFQKINMRVRESVCVNVWRCVEMRRCMKRTSDVVFGRGSDELAFTFLYFAHKKRNSNVLKKKQIKINQNNHRNEYI